MQAATTQNATAQKTFVSSTTASVSSSTQQTPTLNTNNSQQTEPILQNTTPFSNSLERQITDRDSLCNNLKQYVNNISLSDVLFIIGIQRLKIYSHRLILSSRSPVFRALFFEDMNNNDLFQDNEVDISNGYTSPKRHKIVDSTKGGNSSTHLPIVLELPEIDNHVFMEALTFIYGGTIKIHPENVWELLNIANRFEIVQLQTECESLLSAIEASAKNKLQIPSSTIPPNSQTNFLSQAQRNKLTVDDKSSSDEDVSNLTVDGTTKKLEKWMNISNNKGNSMNSGGGGGGSNSFLNLNSSTSTNSKRRSLEFDEVITQRIKTSKQSIQQWSSYHYLKSRDKMKWIDCKDMITVSSPPNNVVMGTEGTSSSPSASSILSMGSGNPVLQFRTYQTANSFGETIILIGGKGCNPMEQLMLFDTNSMKVAFPKFTGSFYRIGTSTPNNNNSTPTVYGHSSTRVGNKIFVIGGFYNSNTTNDQLDESLAKHKINQITIIDDYTVHYSTVSVKGEPPSPRAFHTMVRYGNKIYIFGGMCSVADQIYSDDLYCMDVETLVCTKLNSKTKGTAPSPRGGHSAILIEDKMLIIGGNDKNTEYKDMYFLELDSLTWIRLDNKKLSIPKRSFHSAIRMGNSVLIFGGHSKNNSMTTGSTSSVLGDSWKLTFGKDINNIDDISILKLENFSSPTPRWGHSITRIGAKIYVVGGMASAITECNDVYVVDTVDLPLQATIIDFSELELKTEVGSGNFSTVLKGVYKGQVVAIKKIKTYQHAWNKSKNSKEQLKILKEFKSEVDLLSSIAHSNLVNLLGYCENPYFIVMEYLADNLHEYVQRHKRDFKELVHFAYDIAKGMSYLHHKHILHRDLKSYNILLDQANNVKIADFGIARRKTDDYTMTTRGTVAWCAPEVLRHERFDEKSDVYSYGIVLWEMWTSGEVPYEGMDPIQAGIAVATGKLRPPIPSDMNKDWANVMQRCWHEDPLLRPSFDAIMTILKNISL